MKKIIYTLPLLLLATNSFAVEARSYAILPKDINLLEAQYSSIVTEKNLINSAKVKNELESVNMRYLRTFSIFDNIGATYIQLPYSKNKANLNLGPMKMNDEVYGLGDVRIFLGVGLYNMPALSREEFVKYDKNGARSGCSTLLNIPVGSYDKNKLFNISPNQYSLKNECVLSYTQDNLVAEVLTGFTKYGDNNEYLVNKNKSQKNLYQTEVHLTYNLTPKFWSGVDVFYQNGGEQFVNGVSSKDKMDNTLVGLIANYTIDRGEFVKVNYIKTVNAPTYAAKSDYLTLTYQKLF